MAPMSEVNSGATIARRPAWPRRRCSCKLFEMGGVPYGTRTRVTAVKGRCPGPLDEGDVGARRRTYKALRRGGQASRKCS
jgi:hypothetical protein